MNDLLHGQKTGSIGLVECPPDISSEPARREHSLNLLAEKLKDKAFRKIEGFPEELMKPSWRCLIHRVLHRLPESFSGGFRSPLW